MEGERKSNTAMLTVIAIATLLVAVVGATFAYFSANTTGNNGNVTVQATTAAARDVFISSGNGNIELSITADKMQQAVGSNNYDVIADTSTNDSVTVSLEAGSSRATCLYDIIYTPGNNLDFTASAAASGNNPALREFDISGTSSHNSNNNFSNVDAKGSSVVTLKSDAVIVDDYETTSAPTVDTWTFTAKFYNLAVSQNDNIGQEFGGNISITNVRCTNAAIPSQSGD